MPAQHDATSRVQPGSSKIYSVVTGNSFRRQAAVTQHDHVMSVLNRQMRQNAPLLLQIVFFMSWCACA